jgi:hypothetical protein
MDSSTLDGWMRKRKRARKRTSIGDKDEEKTMANIDFLLRGAIAQFI